MALTFSEIQKYIKEHRLYPKKRWGQNFLIDKNIIGKIIRESGIDKNDLIIEIGTGYGSLTKGLAITGKGVLSIEIDQELEIVLKNELGEYDNIKVLFADVLQVNIEEELRIAFSQKDITSYKVCANIPYNITTPIIFYLLEKCPLMESATLMVQKEVAKRILASPGSKDYGLLTIMIKYYGEARFLMDVSANCFYPKPEVDSTVIQIKPDKAKRVLIQSEKVFKAFLQTAFQKRRKTILNIASGFFKTDKNLVKKKIEDLNLSPASRPENLTIEEFALIVNTLSS